MPTRWAISLQASSLTHGPLTQAVSVVVEGAGGAAGQTPTLVELQPGTTPGAEVSVETLLTVQRLAPWKSTRKCT